jgi:Ner family transcriptional regulator
MSHSLRPLGWHRADIVAALHKKGITLAALSRKYGCGESTFRAALHVARKPRNQIIADVIGASLHDIWPHWHDPAGHRIAGRDSARKPARRSSQIRRANRSKSKPRLTLLQGGAR